MFLVLSGNGMEIGNVGNVTPHTWKRQTHDFPETFCFEAASMNN